MARLAEPLATRLADSAIRAVCQLAVRRIDLRVEGLSIYPRPGQPFSPLGTFITSTMVAPW